MLNNKFIPDMFLKTFLLLIIFVKIISLSSLSAQEENDSRKKLVYKFDIKENISPPVWHRTQKAFQEAHELNADLILIHLNTYGGMVLTADSISTKILNSLIPVIVFIDNNAASAGAWISISCDSIYMRPGGRIGAATVVTQSAEELPDKYQSYMRSSMRSTAEAKGRDPNIAQAMVDADIYIEGIIDSGKVLTFTTSEALKHGFCDGVAETIHEVLHLYGFDNYELVVQRLTTLDKIIGFLINPMISGLLIMLIIGGIYFEMQTPGVGFPLVAAITGAVLYFAPLYLEGLAEHWEILLFVAGVVLIAVEVFALPGFGIPGILGITFVITGLALSMIENVRFDFSHVDVSTIAISFSIVLTSIFLSLITSYFITVNTFGHKTRLFGQLALDSEQKSDMGYTTVDISLKSLIGRTGVSVTVLRPVGKIEIDDVYYDASAESGFINKGENVVVTDYINAQLIVRKI